MALGRAHDLLMQTSWANASLAHTVRGAIAPFDGKVASRFTVEGDDISISSGAVVALAMTFNELCTNATKFGALSVPGGHIHILWTVDATSGRLKLSWIETGGPPVVAPMRKSFGTRMMGSLGQQLSGKVELAYEATGFKYLMDVPVASLMVKPA